MKSKKYLVFYVMIFLCYQLKAGIGNNGKWVGGNIGVNYYGLELNGEMGFGVDQYASMFVRLGITKGNIGPRVYTPVKLSAFVSGNIWTFQRVLDVKFNGGFIIQQEILHLDGFVPNEGSQYKGINYGLMGGLEMEYRVHKKLRVYSSAGTNYFLRKTSYSDVQWYMNFGIRFRN